MDCNEVSKYLGENSNHRHSGPSETRTRNPVVFVIARPAFLSGRGNPGKRSSCKGGGFHHGDTKDTLRSRHRRDSGQAEDTEEGYNLGGGGSGSKYLGVEVSR